MGYFLFDDPVYNVNGVVDAQVAEEEMTTALDSIHLHNPVLHVALIMPSVACQMIIKRTIEKSVQSQIV